MRADAPHDASGRVDIWLNGAFCGAYRGPMADRENGTRRDGAALILYKPIVRAFSRIGYKFNLTRLPIQKYTIALSDFLT
jgi:hypothetical protein